MNTRRIGTHYEEVAAAYLEEQGVRIIDRNVRCGRIGEIDIIGTADDTLIFFEVKYRADNRYGDPSEAVSAAKQRKLRRCGEYYLAYRPADRQVRFDVIAICGEEITWYKNAF